MGNRIEEIIRLEALSDRWNQPINYIWRNPARRSRWRRLLRRHTLVEDRTYPILLRADKVAILPEAAASAVDSTAIDELQGSFSEHELRTCATRIRPVFPIGFGDGLEPIGVHLRGTDRINPHTSHEHFLRSKEDFLALLERTAAAINGRRPSHVFLCGDDATTLGDFRRLLDPGIALVEPLCAATVPGPYRDLFALAGCSAIYLASQFSSFSITAALIGDRPIHMANPSLAVQTRYPARIEQLP